MTLVDWRGVDARALALVYARERARWLVELGWETRDSWAEVERARTSWGLPGLAVLDPSGRVRGLAYFYASAERFELGTVWADGDDVARQLVSAGVEAGEHAGFTEMAGFLYPGVPGVEQALRAAGFDIEAFAYMSRVVAGDQAALPAPTSDDVEYRTWLPGDAEACADLLWRSYETQAATRFAHDGSRQAWESYLGALVGQTACGAFLPSSTQIAVSKGELAGAALVTSLGPGTAHVAQVAVRPDLRGRGVASRLLTGAARQVAAAGFNRVTLLAGSGNPTAQRLYRNLGYLECARFVSANRRRDARAMACAS